MDGWMDVAIMTNRVMAAVKCKTMLECAYRFWGLLQIVHKLKKICSIYKLYVI